MPDPCIRSVAVHWGRLIAACAVATALVILFATTVPPGGAGDEWLVLGVSLLAIAVPVGVGRPWAEHRVTAGGIRTRESLFFSAFPRTSETPWADVLGAEVREELDGSRSLTVRARGGRTLKVWEKFSSGTPFDEFRDAVERGMGAAGAAPSAGPAPVWERGWPRALAGALAAAWLALAAWTAADPPAEAGLARLRLAALALLLLPLALRAFRRR